MRSASTPNQRMYLLGSIHFARADLYPLPPAVDRAFAASTGLIVEVDLRALEGPSTEALIGSIGSLPPGRTLAQVVTPETHARLTEIVRNAGMEPAAVERWQPWWVGLVVLAWRIEGVGYRSANGVDWHFLNRNGGTRPLVALETSESQFRILSALPPPLQEVFLEQALVETAELEAQMRRMTSAWRSGDEVTIEELLFAEQKAEPEQQLTAALVTSRNAAMYAQLRTLFAQDETWFVVVGAGHLVGEDGLLQSFRADGFEVRPVPPEE